MGDDLEMTTLKLQDDPVLTFDLSKGDFHVIKNEKLPMLLRDNIIDSEQDDSRKAFVHNYQALMDFFHNRSLSIERENAKQILNALHIPQSEDDDTVSKMMILCKGLSASDDYWITNNPAERWKDNNLRDNPLHEVLAQIRSMAMRLSPSREDSARQNSQGRGLTQKHGFVKTISFISTRPARHLEENPKSRRKSAASSTIRTFPTSITISR